jgi:hypothetical protein
VVLKLADLRGFAVELLSSVPVPDVRSIIPSREPDDFAKGRLGYTVRCDGAIFTDISTVQVSTFGAFEAWANERRGISRSLIAARYPDLSQGRLESLSLTERAFLSRVIQPPGYRPYTFILGGRKYCHLLFYLKTRCRPSGGCQ